MWPIVLLSTAVLADPKTMWFQPGLWGQPAAVPGMEPIDPPDPTSGYLSALDQYLRPKPVSIVQTRKDLPSTAVDVNPLMIWLAKWREWVQSAPGKELPKEQPESHDPTWWTDRMKAVKSLYDKATRNSDDDKDKEDKDQRKPSITNLQTGAPPHSEEPPVSPDDEILLPPKDILNGLRCRPIVSFQSCADHCVAVLPTSSSSPSLTPELVPKGRKLADLSRMLAEDSKDSSNDTTHIGKDGDRTPQLGNPDEWHRDGWEPWQVAQYKSCLFGVCVVDYLKRPVPGCLGADGNLVPWTDSPNKIRSSPDPTSAAEFDDYDFYDPKRLELWRGLGFYAIIKAWHQLTGGTGAARLVFLPVIVLLALFALPALVIALVLPIVSRLMSSGGMEEPMCESGMLEELWIKTAEPIVGMLTNLGQQGVKLIESIGEYIGSWTSNAFAETVIDDQEERVLELARVTSPPVADAMRKKLVTHGELRQQESSSAGTIDTFPTTK